MGKLFNLDSPILRVLGTLADMCLLNIMTLICFVGTLALSVISWYLIEKPLQRLGAKIVKKIS